MGTAVVVRQVVPSLAVRAVILPDRPPLPLTHVGSPQVPVAGLPQPILDAPRLGCLNVHASLLPRWRGAAPIQWAIVNGDVITGVCVMIAEAGLGQVKAGQITFVVLAEVNALVLEIARLLAAGPRPKRTVVFAATTGEEVGLLGTRWFIAHPPVPLAKLVANLEIEMIGRPDSLGGGEGRARDGQRPAGGQRVQLLETATDIRIVDHLHRHSPKCFFFGAN